MMEMIFRVTDQKYDAEILINVRKKSYFKTISIDQLIDSLNSMRGQEIYIDYKKDLIVADDELIAVSPNCILTKQPVRSVLFQRV